MCLFKWLSHGDSEVTFIPHREKPFSTREYFLIGQLQTLVLHIISEFAFSESITAKAPQSREVLSGEK